MSEVNLEKIEKKLKKALDDNRYRHTLGVMYTAAAMAMRYGADITKAQQAGLLHDCAKCLPNEKKLRLCEKYGLEVTRLELKAPYLLHSKLGAYLAQHKYNVDDPEVCQAIYWHTTGKPDMSLLEKIIFTADYIEPMRCKAERLALIRQTAFTDLDLAVYYILEDTLKYLRKGSSEVDETSQRAYMFYKKLIEERTGKEDMHD